MKISNIRHSISRAQGERDLIHILGPSRTLPGWIFIDRTDLRLIEHARRAGRELPFEEVALRILSRLERLIKSPRHSPPDRLHRLSEVPLNAKERIRLAAAVRRCLKASETARANSVCMDA